jgi:ABC-type antimicrobial peptide transport system permease subunit
VFVEPLHLAILSRASPYPLLPAIEQTIRSVAPAVAIDKITTMDALTAKELSGPRAAVAVSMLFALIAIVLSAVGVYAVVAYEVRQRRRELAVRAALGATSARIINEVTRRSVASGLLGLATGIAMAVAGARALRKLLYELEPTNSTTFALSAVTLLAIVIAASYIPARRAAVSDPAAVLRD